MATAFLGIDVGTSGTKALLLGPSGRVLATATADHPSYFPKPGWSEQHPDDWWASTRKAVKAALRGTKLAAGDIAAIGLSGQMHGSVFLDRDDRPLCRALLWNDQRTTAECAEITRQAGGESALIAMVNNVALTGYTAPKILWLRNHARATFKRVRTIMLPKDYIALQLTGNHSIDAADASGTLLLDVRRRDWSQPLLDKLDLDRALLPDVSESSDVVGTLTPGAAKALGLRRDIPVVAGAGDQAAAAVGTGVVKPGIVSATLGTSGVVFAHANEPVHNGQGLLQAFCHAVRNKWCAFGCMLSAGGSLQWLRETLYATELAQARRPADRDALYTRIITEAAHTDDDDSDPLLFHPYLTGERCPHPHPHARGGWIGLTRRHKRGHLARAVLEGITFGMTQQIEMLRDLGVPVREVRLAGGGARSAWWRQLQADAYGARALTMRTEEGSALGAAILASVGAGAFKDVPTACAKLVATRREHKPDRKRTAALVARRALSEAAYARLEALYRVDL
jgi:xylulokinase